LLVSNIKGQGHVFISIEFKVDITRCFLDIEAIVKMLTDRLMHKQRKFI